MASKRKIRTSASPSKVRGQLVESIVAAMHSAPGVQVRQNVKLPSLDPSARPREIDVLIDGTVVGYPIRIAIECKNEKQVIGPEKIDAFVGKLQHVGLAPQQAIFVSVKGFTKGAIARAKAAGVRTLVLTGLTSERLEAAVLQAVRAIVFLWPVVGEWFVLNDINADVDAPEQLGTYLDETGAIVGSIADLAWRAWLEGAVPATIGTHKIELRLPRNWRNVVAGNVSIPEKVWVTFQVSGIAMSLTGTAHRHDLRDAETKVIHKLQLKARFTQNDLARPEVFATEEELSAFLKGTAAVVRVTSRVRLPRIQWMGAFWPLSMRVAQALNEKFTPDKTGRVPDIGPGEFLAAEKPNLANMWEPLWFSPLLKGILEAQFE